jgi:hypothetical protein
MRKSSKLILVGAALAALAVPSVASADVERCQVTTTVTAPDVTTATFTVQEPRGTKDNFDSLWLSKYNVTVTGDTFEGTGHLTDDGGSGTDVPLTINGSINADGTISYVAKPVASAQDPESVAWVLDSGKTDGTTNAARTLNVEGPSVDTNVRIVDWNKVTKPGQATTTTTEYKNHGEYVSSLGGGKVAAQECVGMPTNSTQGALSTLLSKKK